MGSLGEIMKLCRLCLVKDQVNVPIFEGAGDIRKISQKIGACLPVKVTKDDKLPKKICNGCSHKLDMVYQFWNTTTSSEKQLLEWVNNPSSRPLEERGVVAEHIVLKQEVDNGDSEALDAGEFIDVNETFETIGFAHDDDDEMSNENIDIKTENDSRCDEPPIKKHKTVSLSSAESEEDADDPSDAYNRDDSDEDDNDVSEAQPAFVNVAEADQQPGPSGVGKASGEAPLVQRTMVNGQVDPLTVKSEIESNSEDEVQEDLLKVKLEIELDEAKVPEKSVKNTPNTKKTCKKIVGNSSNAGNQIAKMANKKNKVVKKVIKNLSDTKNKIITKNLSNQEKPVTKNEKEARMIVVKTPTKIAKTWTCAFCEKAFESNSAYRSHKFYYRKRPELHKNLCFPFKCSKCKKAFETEDELLFHVDYSHNKMRRFCDICSKSFSSSYLLKSHKRSHEPGYQKPQYKCESCDQIFLAKTTFKNHMNEKHHNTKHNCATCGREFRTRTLLRIHSFSHSKNNRCLCEICGKMFYNRVYLQEHSLKHTNNTIKKYKCSICNKGYDLRVSFYAHTRDKHLKK